MSERAIPIEDIWLVREGGENDIHAQAVVYVKREGIWYEAIREYLSGNFSHCITSYGLVSDQCKPVEWLNKAGQPKEQVS